MLMIFYHCPEQTPLLNVLWLQCLDVGSVQTASEV